MTTDRRTAARLDVRLIRSPAALHRLLALLHRKAIEITGLRYERHGDGDFAVVDVLIVPERADHVVDSIHREVLVLTVELVAS